jgi:hypothetical protein
MIAATHWLGVYKGKVDFMFSRGFFTACSLAPLLQLYMSGNNTQAPNSNQHIQHYSDIVCIFATVPWLFFGVSHRSRVSRPLTHIFRESCRYTAFEQIKLRRFGKIDR